VKNRYRFDQYHDFTIDGREHTVRINGEISPGYPATGPTYDCGGTPEEPPCVEDYEVWLVLWRNGRSVKERKIEDDGKILEQLHDTILQQADEDRRDSDDRGDYELDRRRDEPDLYR
jgi:hypothetical protein